MTTDKLVVVRTYRASSQAAAGQKMTPDALELASKGYVVSAQSWAPGGRTPVASLFVLAGVLFLVLGLMYLPLWLLALVFLVIGLVSGKGRGELTVTWAKAGQ